MPRPSKKTIEPLLDEWSRLQTRRLSIELKREVALAPHKEAYEKKAKPIVDEANTKLDSITKRMKVLEGDIGAQLMAGVNVKEETVALAEVVVEIETTKSIATAVAILNKADGETPRTNDSGTPLVRAIAKVETANGNREIDAKTFHQYVKESERTGTFWSCLKVLMGNVDKFLGKEKADALAKPKKNYSVSIGLKP